MVISDFFGVTRVYIDKYIKIFNEIVVSTVDDYSQYFIPDKKISIDEIILANQLYKSSYNELIRGSYDNKLHYIRLSKIDHIKKNKYHLKCGYPFSGHLPTRIRQRVFNR